MKNPYLHVIASSAETHIGCGSLIELDVASKDQIVENEEGYEITDVTGEKFLVTDYKLLNGEEE